MDIYFEALLKTVLAFSGILVYARLLGKQQMSQLTFYDYVTGITFGNIAATLAIDPTRKIGIYLFILTVFTVLNYTMGVVTEKSRPLRKLIEGEPVILIHSGRILEHNMAKSRYNMENLMMQLREKDVFNVADVEFALAETDGKLTVLKKSNRRPVSAADLGVSVPQEGLTSELIVDGEIVYQNLVQNNVDEEWLISQLKNMGYNQVNEIRFASMDKNGNLYVDQTRDHLERTVDVSD